MDKQILYSKLLKYGLFPEKLEKMFCSQAFGDYFASNENLKGIITSAYPDIYEFYPTSFKLTRNNNSPRYMGIPHPATYLMLCHQICSNWSKIENQCFLGDYEKISLIHPSVFNKKKRIISFEWYDQCPHKEQLMLDKQLGKRYLAISDISSFFPSIYTHTIPWALVGKDEAKSNIRSKTWYNRIDFACQKMQKKETRGLPIGPDTSSILSEVILSQVDKELSEFEFVRFVDDYRCYCKTIEEAERFLTRLSHYLEKYRLSINTAKTRIIDLPRSIDDSWVQKLRKNIEWNEINKKNKNQIIGFLDLASDLFRLNPDGSSIRFAAKTISTKKYSDFSTYSIVLSYFLNICYLFPYVIDICEAFLVQGIQTFPNFRDQIIKTINNALSIILFEHVKYNRSDVVSRVFYLAIKYSLTIEKYGEIERKVVENDDCVPMLMCFLYCKNNFKNTNKFKELFERNKANPSWWLYSFEVGRYYETNHNDRFYRSLYEKNISFLAKDFRKCLVDK
jgi:hypothetical protein